MCSLLIGSSSRSKLTAPGDIATVFWRPVEADQSRDNQMLRNIDQLLGSAKQMHTSTYGTHSKATEHHIHVQMVRFEGYNAGKGYRSYKDMYRSGGKSGEPDICLFAKAESMHMVTLHHPSDGLFYFIFSYFHFKCTRIFDQNTCQRSKGSGEPVEGFYRIKSPLASRGGSQW